MKRGQTVGPVLAQWPLLGTAYRFALTAHEAIPVARSGLRLLRAEAHLAKECLPSTLWSTVAALFGLWILLGALVCGGVIALHDAGWPLVWAVALPGGLGAVFLVGGVAVASHGVRHLTFIESRARVKALLEVLDDED